MIGIVVCGHGHFGTGVVSALKLLVGEVDFLEGVDFEGDVGEAELSANIKDVVERMKTSFGQVFLLCDILGGSPFKCAATLYAGDESVKILYGANLGMAVELGMRAITGSEKMDLNQMAEELVGMGQRSIGAYTFEEPQDIELEEEEEGI